MTGPDAPWLPSSSPSSFRFSGIESISTSSELEQREVWRVLSGTGCRGSGEDLVNNPGPALTDALRLLFPWEDLPVDPAGTSGVESVWAPLSQLAPVAPSEQKQLGLSACLPISRT